MTIVKKTVEDIKTMKIRGALDIAVAAAEAMKKVAETGKAGNTLQLIDELCKTGCMLKNARPTAVSLPNTVDFILYTAERNKKLEIKEFRNRMSEAVGEFIQDQKNALNKIADIGSNIIEEDETILTHCNSDTVVEVLKKAYDQGKNIKVVCTESRPKYQGILSAKTLSEYGIPTTLIIDSAVRLSMKKLKIDKVIVGADTICANGDLINKIGTSQIAVCAREQKIEFITAAESIKFSPQSLIGSIVPIEERSPDEIIKPDKLPKVKIINPVFDITEAEYINMIITEYGIMPPQAAYQLLKEKFGWRIY